MLDLKAKLAAAGLVTPEQIAEDEKRRRDARAGNKSKRKRGRKGDGKPRLDPAAVAALPRGEQYAVVRNVVEAERLDSAGPMPREDARPFHFSHASKTGGASVGRVFVVPRVADALASGSARVVAYMSHHGLAHAVVPTAIADALAQLFPDWVVGSRGDGPGDEP